MTYQGPRKNVLLKSAIYRSGYKQKEIAEKLGMTESWLSMIVSGRVVATVEEMERICSVLKINRNLFSELTDSELQFFGIPRKRRTT